MAEYFFGITDKGKRREKNEDTFIAQEAANKDFIIACVIDGVGGYNGGEVAAGIARAVIMEHLQNLSGDITGTLQKAVIAANTKINRERRTAEKNEQMACVLTCAIVHKKDNKFYYAHVGDTRLYLLRDHSLVKISKDHSVVGFLEESGKLSEEEAMRHPRRNEINKALGFEEDISIDFIEAGESPFLPGDIILLCSDGLSDMVSSSIITSILVKKSRLGSKAQDLVDAANNAGGNDNITAVLVENNNPPKQQLALKPLERKNQQEFLEEGKAVSKKDIPPAKNNRGLISFLTLLSAGLLITVVVLLSQKNTRPRQPKAIMAPNTSLPINESNVQLISHVNDSTKIYAFKQEGSSMELNAPIIISKDSFHLLGNGAIIKAGSGYKGPGIIVGSSAKYILLDSLVLENLDVGIVVQKNNVAFKNVRFINCRVPVQYALLFPDSVISGRFKDSVFRFNSTFK